MRNPWKLLLFCGPDGYARESKTVKKIEKRHGWWTGEKQSPRFHLNLKWASDSRILHVGCIAPVRC